MRNAGLGIDMANDAARGRRPHDQGAIAVALGQRRASARTGTKLRQHPGGRGRPAASGRGHRELPKNNIKEGPAEDDRPIARGEYSEPPGNPVELPARPDTRAMPRRTDQDQPPSCRRPRWRANPHGRPRATPSRPALGCRHRAARSASAAARRCGHQSRAESQHRERLLLVQQRSMLSPLATVAQDLRPKKSGNFARIMRLAAQHALGG